MKKALAVLAMVGLGAAWGAALPLAQGTSVWDGVYTEAQAKRGGELYAQKCAACHGADLRGADVAPGLIGIDFNDKWNDLPMSTLFDLMRVTMPQDAPGSLTRQQTAEVLAFVLNKGGFPAGTQELAFSADALGQIKYLAQKP